METKSLDSSGISNDGTIYGMMISDHLDWDDEFEHLLLLEKKLNHYLSHIEKNNFLQGITRFPTIYMRFMSVSCISPPSNVISI